MDQVMKTEQRRQGITTTTAKISKARELNKVIIEPHRRQTTTVAPSNSISNERSNFGSIAKEAKKTRRRKWIRSSNFLGPNSEMNSKPKESLKMENSTTANLRQVFIEVRENHQVIRNQIRSQQIDCPDEKKCEEEKTGRVSFQTRYKENVNLDKKVDLRRDKDSIRSPEPIISSSPKNKFVDKIKLRLTKIETPSSKCLLKIGDFFSVTNSNKVLVRRRSEIGVVDKTASYLFLTLLIIITRELYTQIKTSNCNSTSNQLLNDRMPVSATLISQRCLPDLGLIRSCFAASTLGWQAEATTASTAITTRSPTNETLQLFNVTSEKASVTMAEAEAQQEQTTTFRKPTLNLSLKNTTTDAAVGTLVEANNNNTSINNGTTMDSSNTTNHRHQIHQSQLSVLCNSRCSCVILEPLFSKSGQNQLAATVAGKPPPAGTGVTTAEREKGEQELDLTTNSTAAGSYNSERALTAFNEDYSLDYEQPVSPAELEVTTTTTTTTTTTASGNESNNDGPLFKPAESASTSLDGNDRARNGNNSFASSGPTSKLDAGTENSKNSFHSTSSTTNLNLDLNLNSTDISSTVSSSPVNSTAVTASTNPSDVPGSSRQLQPLQGKQNVSNNSSNLNKQTTSQGMTLFPLPSPHLHLHHHHHHGAGAGRDSSGPQLYAQSLYSSQAPKLSYHAHTPYLKTNPSQMSSNTGQQQQQLLFQQTPTNQLSSFNTGDKIYQDASILNPFSLNSSPGLVSSNGLTPGGGGGGPQNGPLQYHHMRSTYVSHHLRLQQQQGSSQISDSNSNGNNNSPANSHSNFIASKINHVFPQQFILVPLKTMNMSQKLKYSSPQRNNSNNNETNSNGSNNDINDYYQDVESNWKDRPELIETIELMLSDIDQNQIQSLYLSNNELSFELWSELYALLAIQMRQHLFHLDLSHNSLIKLGITFTGYIEHHIVAHNGWPTQQQQSFNTNQSDQVVNKDAQTSLTTQKSQPSFKSSKLSKNSIARMRHSLFSGGKLYNLIKDKQNQQNYLSKLKNNNDKANNNLHNTTSNLLQQALLIKALDLSHNKLKWLIKDQFRALKHVQTIRLDYNRIRYIHQHAFSGLESLRFLNLNFNRLQVIYIEQFQTNYNLLALMLRSNYLAYLRGGSFASLANLKRLDLSSNKLTIVSNNAFLGLESLELLNCSSNQFVHAPSASLHPLTSLRKLDISDNSIAQLAPGTFFHLPIEEIWLNSNEQLVAIDRGAFWDLPYLRKLHLRSNPMLMSINSQAFVGTQNLQVIDVEDCQSLDDSARQMLDNITMTTTSRLLRYSEQQQQQQQQQQQIFENINSTTKLVAGIGQSLGTTSPKISNDTTNNGQSIQLVDNSGKQTIVTQNNSPRHSSHHLNQQTLLAQSNRLKYIYYASVLTFLVVALKLVFKYTSTTHYMEARRRRRRVYEANSNKQCNPNNISDVHCFTDTDDGNSMLSSNVDAFPMCVQPESRIFGLGNNSGVINSNNNNHNVNNNLGPEQIGHNVEQQCISSDTVEEVGELEDGHQQQQQPKEQVVGEHGDASIDISVISNSVSSVIPISSPTFCPNCPQQAQQQQPSETVGQVVMGDETHNSIRNNEQVITNSDQSEDQQNQLHNLNVDNQQQASDHSTFDLLHSQLVAAGFDYGHANCAHFYQSLGPALQLADITANFVNNMDYY